MLVPGCRRAKVMIAKAARELLFHHRSEVCSGDADKHEVVEDQSLGYL